MPMHEYPRGEILMIHNARTIGKVYYGLHFSEGVAEYREPGQDPYRILINENTIKEMNPSFAGRPVYVHHVDEVDLDNLQAEADGYVVESFYNKADGKTWAKFIVVSDQGHDAIRNGWKLSNAYIPQQFSNGGLWHGVEFQKEVTRAEFEHLAIVPNPRYEESVILTPEEFKKYNSDKEQELIRVANSLEKGESMFNIFKRTKVENTADIESMVVTLPKSKTDKTLTQLVNEADQAEMEKKNVQYANLDHMVKVGNEEMKLNDLVSKHMEMKQSMEEAQKKSKDQETGGEPDQTLNEEDLANKKKNEEEAKAAEEKKKNEEKDMAEKKKNEEKEQSEKKQNAFNALKNAPNTPIQETVLDLSWDQLERGKSRYGSGN